jgi:type IV fimbrial biogenesis protein FimT
MGTHLRFKLQKGFNLVELLVGIAILAILLVMAAPSFYGLIQNDFSITLSNNMITSLNYARSEAIKRGSNVSVCASSDTSFTSCGTNWANGWIVFLNPTGSNAISTATVLRTQSVDRTGATITTAPSMSIATYTSNGFATNTTSNVTMTIKTSGCTADYGRSIAISLTGRLSVSNVSCP